MSLWGNAVGAVLEHVLYRSGGTMTGSIDMGQNPIEGLKAPNYDDQATNKKYVDDSVKVATGAAAGAQATADAAAAAAASAGRAAEEAQNTANGKADRFVYTISVPASEWFGSTAPFTQAVSVREITSNDRPHYGVVYSSVAETRLKERDAFSCIDDLDTANGSVTFTCFDEKPAVNLTIQLEVIR